jgi:superfamily II DNA or RNA helicase
MSQVSLFDRPKAAAPADDWASLRHYQREACEALIGGFDDNRSQLAVLATGLGKSVIAGALARYWLRHNKGNVLMLANRDELVQQGAGHLQRMCGETCEIEQAQHLASRKARLVMASVDTIKQQHRLDRFGRGHFGLIIADEAQHFVGNTYVKPLDYFQDAKVLGLTATPDRADEKALGQVFDSVGYVRDILAGIEDGYLVPLSGRQVQLGEIQLDGLGKVAGDLAKGQLDEVMVRAVEGVVHKTLELEPHRRAIAFWPGIKSAEYAMERFNALEPGSTCFIHGGTEEGERKRLVAAFRSGAIKRLMNVGIAIEGFDAPATSLIIQARPTLSRMFYAQSCGRGTRVLPGTVEHIPGAEGAAARRAAVAASEKPTCVVLDFVGNATKHALIGPEDLLGGDYEPAEIELAKKKAKGDQGGDVKKRLEEARRELAAVAAAVRSKVQAHVSSFNPFAILEMDLTSTTREDLRWGRQPPSEAQLAALERMKVPKAALKTMSQREASKLLKERNRRHDAGLATFAQLHHLRAFGIDNPNVTFRDAGAALTYVATNNAWKAPHRLDLAKLRSLAGVE